MALSKAMDHPPDNPGTIPSKGAMDRRVVGIMIISAEAAVGLWRPVWRGWRAVVVWMLVCCFELDGALWVVGDVDSRGCGERSLYMYEEDGGHEPWIAGQQHTHRYPESIHTYGVAWRGGGVAFWSTGWTCHLKHGKGLE